MAIFFGAICVMLLLVLLFKSSPLELVQIAIAAVIEMLIS